MEEPPPQPHRTPLDPHPAGSLGGDSLPAQQRGDPRADLQHQHVQHGALDAITKEELLQIWKTPKCKVLMIIHDIDEALNIDFLYNRFAHDDDEVA